MQFTPPFTGPCITPQSAETGRERGGESLCSFRRGGGTGRRAGSASGRSLALLRGGQPQRPVEHSGDVRGLWLGHTAAGPCEGRERAPRRAGRWGEGEGVRRGREDTGWMRCWLQRKIRKLHRPLFSPPSWKNGTSFTQWVGSPPPPPPSPPHFPRLPPLRSLSLAGSAGSLTRPTLTRAARAAWKKGSHEESGRGEQPGGGTGSTAV